MAASQAASSNELVMSNEEITAALSNAPDEEPAEPSDSDGLNETDEDTTVWENQAEGEDDGEDADSDKGTKARSKSPASVRKVRANGKTIDVNMGDQAAVDRLLSLGLSAPQAFSKAAKLEKQTKALESQLAELQKYKDNWTKLEARKSDKKALYQAIFGTAWDEDIKADREYQDRYNNATPAERQWMDQQRALQEDRRKLDQERTERDGERQRLDQERDQLKLESLQGVMVPEFQRLEFTSRIKDEATAERMNKALWKLAISELKDQYGELDTIPPSAIRKVFKETHDMLWSNHKQAADQRVKEITNAKKTKSKQQAQLASTRSYSSTGQSNLKDLAKDAKDPVKLWRKMFR